MDIYVLNSDFEEIGIIDVFQSLIWTTRYYDSGDFELYLPATTTAVELLTSGKYIVRDDISRVMIIQKIEITTDVESGNYITVSGNSVESILSQRIILSQTNLNTTVQEAIYRIVDENAVTCSSMTIRKFPNLTLETPALETTEKVQMQTTYADLQEKVSEICKLYGIGWKILRNGKNLVFSLFRGVDRSESQSENAPVTFSPEYDNLINSNYHYDASSFKNSALIAGEGEGTARKTWGINQTTAGYDRYELYVDAKDISSNNGEIGSTEYYNLLEQRGYEKLAEHSPTYSFDGEIDPNVQYIYGTDYNLGDIVQIENEYGITATARIIEIIESWSANEGYTAIPTFADWGLV